MLGQSVHAYGQTQNLALPPRRAEAMAFAKAVALLNQAGAADDPAAYSSALGFNQLLWTIVQADVAGPGNALPEGLRKTLLSLSVFVDRQTLAAYADPSAERLMPLIRINENIAKGLFAG
ncbi:MAG: flagellar biosynthesis regulator FlaF [Rhodospirillales bacterium]|jgi:flagellar protein FlaF|nr:flagellar biosynthesis regulator FlaF [Rhodospirillales bacterium]MDP6774892.1 flagellar biosynthesis regulator FlaF [Rhodospirillales bacterium]